MNLGLGSNMFGLNMPSHPIQGQAHMGAGGAGLSMSMINQPRLSGPGSQVNGPLQSQQSFVPSSSLWPGSASLPNIAELNTISTLSPGALGNASAVRPKKRARTDDGADAVTGTGQQNVKQSTPDSDNEGEEDELVALSPAQGDVANGGALGLRQKSVVSDTSSGGQSLLSSLSSLQNDSNRIKTPKVGTDTPAHEDNSLDMDRDSKAKTKSFAPSKKKKIPPPGGFKPWNTSPSSSHLPSGSACINPVTGEVELPPMENLTKEEIRKVKNRASAQRSRTRKGELLGGLMEEVNRLRERLREVTNGAEGGDTDDASIGAEEFLRKTHAARSARGGSVLGGGSATGHENDEEREGMKMLIERLRAEVIEEKKGREAAQSEAWAWKNKYDELMSSAALGPDKTINPGLIPDPLRKREFVV